MKPTLTIGIAAYNEEGNIGRLIEALLGQTFESVDLVEIIVVSDGSTDATDRIVTSFHDRDVRLIRLEGRLGQNTAQNKIHEGAISDMLVVLDADMLPSDEKFIEKMVEPITMQDADLVGVQLEPSGAVSFFERMLATIHRFKVRMYENIRTGKNIYMCFGPARSFSKKLYSQLRYPDDCPTDAYSYLFAKKIGYKFVSVKNPPALFKVPSSITDHIRQSSRFVTGQRTLGEQFGESEVKEEFRIPRGLLLREGIKELYAHPIFVCVFVFLNLYVRMTQSRYRFTSRWEIATTTKSLYWP